jgi:hypothetical protein
MKFGDAEFEIEGCTSKELEEKISSLCDIFKQVIEKNQKPSKSKEKPQDIKRIGGQGKGTTSYMTNIRRIIQNEPDWFVDKAIGDVASKLTTEYSVPGAKEIQVSVALTRLFKKGILSRKDDKGKYLYSIAANKTSK